MKTRIQLRYLIALCLFTGVVSSCAPTVTRYRLDPVSGDIAQIEGRPTTKAEQNGIGVVASFEREDMEFVVFDIEVKNKTDHSITVNPADFRYTLLANAQDTTPVLPLSDGSFVRQAADPDYETGRVQLKQKKEEKRLKTAKVINTVLFAALIVSDVAASSKSRNYNEWRTNRVNHDVAWQALNIKRAVDYGSFANRMQRYDYEAHRWRDLAMKSSVVPSGESVRGFIYLPKTAQAQFLHLTYALDDEASVPLVFQQRLIEEKKRRRRN